MVYYKINLRHPFTMLIAGPTGCVRTEFVKKLIDNEQIVSKPIPECVVYFHGEYQEKFNDFEMLNSFVASLKTH